MGTGTGLTRGSSSSTSTGEEQVHQEKEFHVLSSPLPTRSRLKERERESERTRERETHLLPRLTCWCLLLWGKYNTCRYIFAIHRHSSLNWNLESCLRVDISSLYRLVWQEQRQHHMLRRTQESSHRPFYFLPSLMTRSSLQTDSVHHHSDTSFLSAHLWEGQPRCGIGLRTCKMRLT